MQNLFRAIKNNNEEECINILENENIDIHTKDDAILDAIPEETLYIRKASPIVIASDVGNPKIVEALILKGANLDDTDSNGLNSLMKASVYGYTDIIKLLLSNGINIHKKSNNNGSAILYASLHSQKEVVQLLLSEGSSIYDKTMFGSSCVDVTYNKEIKSILEKWPITMVIIILEELSLNGDLLESNITDLQEYFGPIV
jgi:ankyrin repeat protein